MTERIVVTGGAGFIGSAVVRNFVEHTNCNVLNLDKLTYAGNLASLESVDKKSNYQFVQCDICDRSKLDAIFAEYKPSAIVHLAAESHVDRSIDGAGDFISTNVVGTFQLLEAARAYWQEQSNGIKDNFRLLHVSTDEVYGDLQLDSAAFRESDAYAPSSPYAASKASSDHLVRAWHRTYGLPIVLTNCSNNYGPFQFPEKLIPLMILSMLKNEPLPIYGDGKQRRDWLHVEDHADALWTVLHQGTPGETYNIGGNAERKNIDIVEELCDIMDELVPAQRGEGLTSYRKLITFVKDRPGHDIRYAIDASKIYNELGWKAKSDPSIGLRDTVAWYLENQYWWTTILNGSYRLERQGL